MATRLNIFFLLAVLILCISAPTFAVLIKSEDIDTLEKLEATARKYFSKGDPTQLEQSDVARGNYVETLETLMLQTAQLTGLIPDTYMRVKKEFVKKEIHVARETVSRLIREREHFTSQLLQTMGGAESTTLKHRLTLAEFDENVEAYMAYMELLETRLRLLWTDGDVTPSSHILPKDLVTHGFVTLGYRYFIEDTGNLMFSVHPHNLRIAESLYDIFYEALLTLHSVHLKLSLPFPKAKNPSLQPRFDRFNPRDKEASLLALGIDFIRNNIGYFERKLDPLTRTITALRTEIRRLAPPEVLPPSTLVLGSEWVVVDEGMGDSPFSPALKVGATPFLGLAAQAFRSPSFSPQPSSSGHTKVVGTEEVLRPALVRVEAPQVAPRSLAASVDRSGTASVHSFFGDDWEDGFDELSADSRGADEHGHVVYRPDSQGPGSALAATLRTSPVVSIASSLSQADEQWDMVGDAVSAGVPPSSAKPVLQDGAVDLLHPIPSLHQGPVGEGEGERQEGAVSPHSDFELVYDDLTDGDIEERPQSLVHQIGDLIMNPPPAGQDGAEDLDLLYDDLNHSAHSARDANQETRSENNSSFDEEDLQTLLKQRDYHSSLQAQVAEREVTLKKFESSTHTATEAHALAKERAMELKRASHALKERSYHPSHVTDKFRSTLKSVSTRVKSATNRAKENIQSRIRRALPLQSPLKSNRNVEPLPSSSKTPIPLLGENLEAPVSSVSQLFQVEELRTEPPFQINSPQDRAPVVLGNSSAPIPYSSTSVSTPLPLPISLTEIIVPSRKIGDPTQYGSIRVASPELLSAAPTNSRIFNLNNFLIPFSLIMEPSQDVAVDAPYSSRSAQAHLSYGLSSSTKRSPSDTNHVGSMRGATGTTSLTANSGSGGASFHETHQKASSYSPYQDTTRIQKLSKTPHYPTMRMPLPHRGNRRLFDSLVAVAA